MGLRARIAVQRLRRHAGHLANRCTTSTTLTSAPSLASSPVRVAMGSAFVMPSIFGSRSFQMSCPP